MINGVHIEEGNMKIKFLNTSIMMRIETAEWEKYSSQLRFQTAQRLYAHPVQ